MSDNNRILTAGAVAAAGLMIAGGAAAAQAATSTAPAATGYGSTPGYGAPPGYGDGRGRGGHEHTTVTGDEATRVKEAVTAKDSAVTVEQVLKDPDGSYDVIGTKAGQRVMVEVSKDLKTVEVRTGGRGGHGRHGGQPGQTPAPSTSGAASPAGYAV